MSIDFPRIIQELAINLQQPLMEPVEDACRISWDNVDMHLYYHNDDNVDLLIASLDIGEIPYQAQERVHGLMLQANYLWIASEYATLSINPETHHVALCDKIEADLVEVEALTERVKQLYQTAIYWQEIIADESEQMTSGAPEQPHHFGHDIGIKI